MKLRRKSLVLAFTLILTVTWVTPIFAWEEPDAFSMAADTILARPLGIAATILGTAFFVVSLPFTAASGSVDKAAQKLVVDPFSFTFDRPLGEFPETDYNDHGK
jgi:hypothetical protein